MRIERVKNVKKGTPSVPSVRLKQLRSQRLKAAVAGLNIQSSVPEAEEHLDDGIVAAEFFFPGVAGCELPQAGAVE
jgi:hypothetical protein